MQQNLRCLSKQGCLGMADSVALIPSRTRKGYEGQSPVIVTLHKAYRRHRRQKEAGPQSLSKAGSLVSHEVARHEAAGLACLPSP